MKKSASSLHKALPASTLYIAPGMKHGELSLANPREYVEIITAFITGSDD